MRGACETLTILLFSDIEGDSATQSKNRRTWGVASRDCAKDRARWDMQDFLNHILPYLPSIVIAQLSDVQEISLSFVHDSVLISDPA